MRYKHVLYFVTKGSNTMSNSKVYTLVEPNDFKKVRFWDDNIVPEDGLQQVRIVDEFGKEKEVVDLLMVRGGGRLQNSRALITFKDRNTLVDYVVAIVNKRGLCAPGGKVEDEAKKMPAVFNQLSQKFSLEQVEHIIAAAREAKEEIGLDIFRKLNSAIITVNLAPERKNLGIEEKNHQTTTSGTTQIDLGILEKSDIEGALSIPEKELSKVFSAFLVDASKVRAGSKLELNQDQLDSIPYDKKKDLGKNLDGNHLAVDFVYAKFIEDAVKNKKIGVSQQLDTGNKLTGISFG
jgi:8-oxo-dGTP pyrophosphatase MutT (NUDIX family)